MRSRYSAFVVGDEDYLLRSWDPTTRPRHVGLDPDTEWTGLEILRTGEGTPFHTQGTVEFRAHYKEEGRAGALREHSRFRRHEGEWVYLDALADRPLPAMERAHGDGSDTEPVPARTAPPRAAGRLSDVSEGTSARAIAEGKA